MSRDSESGPPAPIELPPIDQVSYMVRDRDEAVRRFEPLFGPFTTLETDNAGARYRGEPHDVEMRIAFGRSGDLEVELIEHVRGESPHKDWIEAHGESLMHVRFIVDDVDAKLAEMERHGYETVWYNHISGTDIKYGYSQAPPELGGHIFEFGQGF